MPPTTTEEKIRGYIFSQYPALGTSGLANETSLAGILDSLAVLGVIGFIEPEFMVELTTADLTDENFESIASIARLVDRLSAAAAK
jgi:acyl carrier protein